MINDKENAINRKEKQQKVKLSKFKNEKKGVKVFLNWGDRKIYFCE